jgi:superfamily II DNA or RNA helicase
MFNPDLPIDPQRLRELLSDNTPDLTGNTYLHYMAKLGVLDRIAPALLKELVSYERLVFPNLDGLTVFDFAREQQQMWALPKEEVYKLLYRPQTEDLRPHQKEGFENFKDWEATPIDPLDSNTREGLFWSATGSGKTRLGAETIKYGLQNGKKTLWVVHSDELIEQARNAIEAVTGEPCEIEKADKRATGKANIVIASTQSLYGERLKDLETRFTPDYIYFDEAHRSLAPTCIAVKSRWSNAKQINLTATPFRADIYKPLDLGRVLLYYPLDQAIADGYCVPPKLLERIPLNLKGVTMANRDYETKSLTAAMLTDENMELCLKLMAKYIPNNRTLLAAASVEHGKAMTERLQKMGFKVSQVYGNTPDAERETAFADIKSGKIEVLVSYNVIKEGNDIPELTNVFMMRPTKLDVLYHQLINRAGRTDPKNPSKTSYGLLDVIDSIKLRKGRKVQWPDESELNRAKLNGSTKTAFEIFLERFVVRKEAALELLDGTPRKTNFDSAEKLFTFLHPAAPIPNTTLTKLQALWPTVNDTKEMKKVASLLHLNNLDMFTQAMVNQGCLYIEAVPPKTIEELEAKVSENGADFPLDPKLSLFGTPKNFITGISTGRMDFKTQVDTIIKNVVYGDTEVYWQNPMNQGGFSCINFDDPTDRNKRWMLIRDDQTGNVGAFFQEKAIRYYLGRPVYYWPADKADDDTWTFLETNQSFNPQKLPGYAKGQVRAPGTKPAWMTEPSTQGQQEPLASAVAKALRIKVGDAAARLNPNHPEALSFTKKSASAVICNSEHKHLLKRIAEDLNDLRPKLMKPTTPATPQPEAPVVVPVDPQALVKEYELRIKDAAIKTGENPGLLYSAAIQTAWRLKHANNLTNKAFEAVLQDPKAMITRMQQPTLARSVHHVSAYLKEMGQEPLLETLLNSAEPRIAIFKNPSSKSYYAFKSIPGQGVSIKYGSYSQDPEVLKSAYCSQQDLLVRRETCATKFSEKWHKFHEHAIYTGDEPVEKAWSNVASILAGGRRNPAKVTASREHEVRQMVAEYNTLVSARASKHGLMAGQLKPAVMGMLFELDAAGLMNRKLIDELLDEPADILSGKWRQNIPELPKPSSSKMEIT